MWEKVSNLASYVAGEDEAEGASSGLPPRLPPMGDTDAQIQQMEQERMIVQLKEMIRESEKLLSNKDAELKKVSADFSKFRLQSKSKIATLTAQAEQAQKSMTEHIERASVGSDESTGTMTSDTSQSPSSTTDAAARAKMMVLKKRLADKDRKISERDRLLETKQRELEAKTRVIVERDIAVESAHAQIAECNGIIERLQAQMSDGGSACVGSDANEVTCKQLKTQVEEMLAQMIRKDEQIIQLTNELDEQAKRIIDLHENVAEKDEVIRARDQVVQLLQTAARQQAAEQQASESSSSGQTPAAVTEVLHSLEQKLMDSKGELATKSKMIEQLQHDLAYQSEYIRTLTEQWNAGSGSGKFASSDDLNILSAKLSERDEEILQLKARLDEAIAAGVSCIPDPKFSKFKALAGSKIKTLEKEIEELKQSAGTGDEIVGLRNHVAELEEEKGNLQLQLIDMEDALNKQGAGLLTQQVSDLCQQLQAIQLERDQLVANSAVLNANNEQLNQSFQQALAHEAELKRSYDSLGQQLLDLQNAFTRETTEKGNTITLLEDKMRDIVTTHEQLDSKMQGELNQIVSENMQLKLAAEQSAGENLRLRSRLEMTAADALQKSAAQEERDKQSYDDACKLFEHDMAIVHERLAAAEASIIKMTEERTGIMNETQSLRDKLQQVETELAVKNKQVELMSADATINSETIDRITLELNQKHDLVEKLTSDLSAMEKLIQQKPRSSAEESRINQKIVEMEEHRASQNFEISSLNARIKELLNEVNEKELLIEAGRTEVVLLTNRLQTQYDSVEKYSSMEKRLAENEELSTRILASKDMRITELLSEVDCGREEMQQLRTNIDHAAAQNQFLEDSVLKLEKEVSDRDKQICILNEDIRMKVSSIDELRGKEEEQTTTAELQKQCEISDLRNSMKELQVKLAESSVSIMQLSTELHESRHSLEMAENKIADRDRKIASLSENYQEEEAQLIALSEEMEALRLQLAACKNRSDALEAQLSAKHDALLALEDNVEKKDAKEKKYMALIKKLKQQVDEQQSQLQKQESASKLDQQATFSAIQLEMISYKNDAHEKAAQIEMLTESVEQHKQTLKEKTAELTQLYEDTSRELANEKNLNETLKSDLSNEVKAVIAVNQHLANIRSTFGLSSSDNIIVLEARLAEILNQNLSLTTENAKFASSAETYTSRIQTLELEKANMHALIATLKDAAKQGEDERRGHLSQSSSENRAMHDEIRQLRDTVDACNSSATVAQNQLASYHEELSRKTDEIMNLNARISYSDDEVTRLQSQIDILHERATEQMRLTKIIDELSDELLTARNDVELLKAENTRLISDAGSASTLIECKSVIQERLPELESHQGSGNMADWPSTSASQQQTLEKLTQLQADNVSLVAQLNELRAVNSQGVRRIDELEQDVKNVQDARSLLENERLRLDGEAARLRDRASKAELSMQQIIQQLEMERQHFTTVEGELQGSIEEMQLEIARISQKLDVEKEKRQQDSKQHHEKMSQLSNETTVLKETNVKLESELTHLRTALEQVKGEWKHLNAEAERTRVELENAKMELMRLTGECDSLKLEKAEALSVLNAKIEEVTRTHDTMKQQYDMLAGDIEHYQHIVDQLKSKNSQLEEKIKTTAYSATNINELAAEKQTAELERKRADMLSAELEEERKRIAALGIERDTLNWKIQEFGEVEEELEETRNKLFSAQTEMLSLKQSIADLEQQSVAYETLNAEHAALSERYEKTLQDNSTIMRQSQELYAQLRRYQETEAQYSTLSEKHRTITTENESLVADVNRLHEEISSLEAKLKAVQSSSQSVVRVEAQQALRSLPLTQERQIGGSAADDDDSPKVHAAQAPHHQHRGVAPAGDILATTQRALASKEQECSILSTQTSELLRERDHLLGELNSLTAYIKQREAELGHVHQQYQLLYEQFVALQQHYTVLQQQQQQQQQPSSPASDNAQFESLSASKTLIDPCLSDLRSSAFSPVASRDSALHSRIGETERFLSEARRDLERAEHQASVEREERLRTEDSLRITVEQLNNALEQIKLHELSWSDLQSVTVAEQEEEWKVVQPQTALLARKIKTRCRTLQRWIDGSSILVGRLMCSQPRSRRIVLIYAALLHFYIFFGCLLSWF